MYFLGTSRRFLCFPLGSCSRKRGSLGFFPAGFLGSARSLSSSAGPQRAPPQLYLRTDPPSWTDRRTDAPAARSPLGGLRPGRTCHASKRRFVTSLLLRLHVPFLQQAISLLSKTVACASLYLKSSTTTPPPPPKKKISKRLFILCKAPCSASREMRSCVHSVSLRQSPSRLCDDLEFTSSFQTK